MVVLITGRPDSGKTYHAYALAREYAELGILVTVLDGDEIRAETDDRDFTDEGRCRNLEKIALMAAKFEGHGITVIVACVSPRREWRDSMRSKWQASRLVYLPGGRLWRGTEYEIPLHDEY